MLPSQASAAQLSRVPSLHWSAANGLTAVPEQVVIEAPLALEIAYQRAGLDVQKVLAVTMRTPGADEELALGFILAEGLIRDLADVVALETLEKNARGETIVTQSVRLARAPAEDLQRISRGLLTSSACGLCGRPSLEGLPLVSKHGAAPPVELQAALLIQLPAKLQQNQPAFFASGGCHGAALATADGELLLVREDVGRHNAVDKVLGAALQKNISVAGKILVLSGRASFELLQKASVAGVSAVMSVGAPSSAAVQLAHAAGVTLIGFAREGRFNVYAHAERIDIARMAESVSANGTAAGQSHAPVLIG